jgi:cell division inhibitor SepF
MPAVAPVTVRPTSYEDAKEIADRFKEGAPVIINVQSTDPKTMRRIIDFASGVCYANNGTMEKMSNGVFMMKPFGARVSRN